MKENKKKSIALVIVTILVAILYAFGFYNTNKDKDTQNIINSAVNEIKDYITTYNMTDEQIEELPSRSIIEQNITDEQKTEQEVESESFEEQGEIAYNGTSEYPQVSLGDYQGLTYYSQIDTRWKDKTYSSVNDHSQTIGTSGCGPTSAAMIVTACKGTITPPEMSDLFTKYGYRSSNNGTYLSAFRFVADTFDIEYQETFKLDEAVNLLRNNHYLVVSVGNGLFTTGGHLMTIIGIEGDMLKIYDPYLYAGKFDTSTRRGKVNIQGNTVYCSIDNFRNYANYTKFFAYKHSGNVQENNQAVVTSTYTRYVKVNTLLNVRSTPNGVVIGSLKNGEKVTVYETSGNWSRIGEGRWVCNTYLSENYTSNSVIQSRIGSIKKLSRACTLYANSDLTGIRYNYKANTTITILQNVSSNVDKVRVNATGRIAYVNNSYFTNVVISQSKSTTRKLKSCTLYSKSNLSGTQYQYKSNTTVTVLQRINSYIDKIKVNATNRLAYVNVSNYQ